MFGRLTVGVARYGVPGAVLGVILAWLSGTSGPQVQAQPTGPGGEPLLTHPQRGSRVIEPGIGVGIGKPATLHGAAVGESSGTIALVVPSNNGTAQWLYIIDTKSHSFAIYRADTANPKAAIKLEAARQYQWDLKLDNYNNSGLEPAAIEKIVKSLAQQAKH